MFIKVVIRVLLHESSRLTEPAPLEGVVNTEHTEHTEHLLVVIQDFAVFVINNRGIH